MTRFRAKPVEIEAVRWTGKNTGIVKRWLHERAKDDSNIALFIVKKSVNKGIWENVADENWSEEITAAIYDFLHETYVGLKEGQWIICGTHGEFYPIDDNVLRHKYEEVT